MVIKQLKKNIGNDIQIGYLEGVIMPNGEFIHNGKGEFLREEEKVYILDNK